MGSEPSASAGSGASGSLHPAALDFAPSLIRRLTWVLVTGALILLAAIVLATLAGAESANLFAAWRGEEPDRTLLFSLRLPRVVLAALTGAALATSGTAFQALLRNPLADPFVLGISGGAALGATATTALGTLPAFSALAATTGLSPSTPAAFLGALGATLLVYVLGRAGGELSRDRVLLVGVIFNSFAGALITGAHAMLAPERMYGLMLWLMGSLGYERWPTLLAASVYVVLGAGALFVLGGRMNLLLLGDEQAAALGVRVGRVRALIFLAASLTVGAAVSLSGMIGFVGLIVPHAARMVAGPDHRLLVPAAALWGAAFLVLADLGARLAFAPLGTEPPVGAVTALCGAPFFLWLLTRRRVE